MRRRRGTSRSAAVEPTWLACSLLLDYPTQRLIDGLEQVAALAPGDPHLQELVTYLRVTPLPDAQAEYVATFDLTRRCAPYLTYYAYGDTRRRGVALLEVKQAYRRAGVEWTADELPDHLCAVLRLGATVDVDTAWKLLRQHRAGVEMLRIALAGFRRPHGGTGSPWHSALLSLCATFPPLHGDDADAVARLVAEGPPAEEVGLAPYSAEPLIAGPRIPVLDRAEPARAR
ncbi:nitrate reductase molybdenum cofactor assembly chaperone [Pseudactinotalea suaedae]|uniref:nitrate reductase molybdenum cofactor assembly chaperone n=1 Tax=Pseudactinotalea suaedae TaxID=1524924 RepID=UPI0012E2D258|nr:nitrate reductase molybdenum cofactor assembly chaperone [Pseudactinotalea suaedae]